MQGSIVPASLTVPLRWSYISLWPVWRSQLVTKRSRNRVCGRLLRYDPSASQSIRLGEFYLRRGAFDRAAAVMEDAAEADPPSAEAFYLLALAKERDYQYAGADEAYARAASLEPDIVSAGLCCIQAADGKHQKKGLRG